MIKIALLSDIHFGKDSRSSDFAIPGQILDNEITGGSSLYAGLEAKLLEYKPNYLICTGDLTSSGKPLEFKYCLEKLYSLAVKASIPPENLIYCVGNHDVDWSIIGHSEKKEEYINLQREIDSTESDFLKIYYSSLSHSWLQSTELIDGMNAYNSIFSKLGPVPMTGLIDREDLAIFVLNSGFLCSKDQGIIHGEISTPQLNWLEAELKSRSESKKWTVIILHHHPFVYEYPITVEEYSTLKEGPQLQTLCGKYGVNLVLHGHYHFPRAKTQKETNWNNPVTFISSGSLSVNHSGRLNGEIPNTFHYIELEEYPSIIKLITYEYTPRTGWSKVLTNRETLPLDHEMYFGDITVNDNEAKEIIESFPKNRPISYEEIDLKLKYITPSHLNELIKEVYGLNLAGNFPGKIQIHQTRLEERTDG